DPQIPMNLAIAPDTGSSNNDGITNAGNVTITGTLAENNLSVRLYDVTTQTDLGDAVVTGMTFSATLNLSEGPHRLQARAIDQARNVSDRSYLDVVVDQSAPALASLPGFGSNPRTTTVATEDVTFFEPINLSAFDYHDLSLTLNGGSNLINSGVTIALVS